MAEPFLGEIGIFGFPFAPNGWAVCNGASLLISQASTLYSLVGTSFGGDGVTRFMLPNLIERSTCSAGTGPALSPRTVGETFGAEAVTIDNSTLPAHTHVLSIRDGDGNRASVPNTGCALSAPIQMSLYLTDTQLTAGLAPGAVAMGGGGLPHPNQQPMLSLNFGIALQGAYPAFP